MRDGAGGSGRSFAISRGAVQCRQWLTGSRWRNRDRSVLERAQKV